MNPMLLQVRQIKTIEHNNNNFLKPFCLKLEKLLELKYFVAFNHSFQSDFGLELLLGNEFPTFIDCVLLSVGYPVMIKASAGGGGKGMRIAWNDEETRYHLCLCHEAEQLAALLLPKAAV